MVDPATPSGRDRFRRKSKRLVQFMNSFVPTFRRAVVSIDERNRSMKMCGKLVIIATLAVGMMGCAMSGDEGGIVVFSHTFDFSKEQGEWEVDFSDFPASATDTIGYG